MTDHAPVLPRPDRRPAPRLKVVDIGANPIDADPPYAAMLRAGDAEVLGFEPNPAALAPLNARRGPLETLLPARASATVQRHTLHICQAPGMTSLLPPDPAVLGLFHGFPDWGRVLATEQVETGRLDDVPETAGADLLKLDIQGAELMVLRHAEARLARGRASSRPRSSSCRCTATSRCSARSSSSCAATASCCTASSPRSAAPSSPCW